MASMDAGPHAHRGDMRARADAAIADTSACANRTDMSAAIHAVAIHASARLDHISDMSASPHAAITGAGSRAHRADMGARAHTMAADMRADTHTQHLYPRADIGEGQCGCEQGKRDEADGQGFHGANPVMGHAGTTRASYCSRLPCQRVTAAWPLSLLLPGS
jgi:hypothetical protein